MEKENLIEIWETFRKDSNNQITKEMIEKQLQPKLVKSGRMFAGYLIFYLAFTLAGIVFLAMNLPGYRSNPVMLAVESGLLFLSIAALVYGLYIFVVIRDINNYSHSLSNLVQSRLGFLRTHFEAWQVIMALMVLVVSFALNTYVDNMNGTYRINNPGMYVLIGIFVFLFVYGVTKLSTMVQTRELKSHLLDLEETTLEHSVKREKKKKKYWLVALLVFVVLTVMLVLGTLMALKS